MSRTLVKSFYNDRAAPQKHSACVMPNGAVASLVSDNNLPALGGGGTARVHVYVSNTAHTSFTLSQYWDIQTYDLGRQLRASMSIDVSGNLHVVYSRLDGSGNEGLFYRKLTYSSGSYSLGSEETIVALGAQIFTAVDIDSVCDSTTMPIIAATVRTGSAPGYTNTTRTYHRNSATSWPSITLRTSTQDGSSYVPDLCITARDPAAVGGAFQAVVSFNLGPSTNNYDPGDIIWIVRYTLGGAALGSSQYMAGHAKGFNLGYRNYDVFWLSNDAFMVYGTIQSSPHKVWYTIVGTSTTSNTGTQLLAPRVVDIPRARYYRLSYKLMSSSLVRDNGSGTSGTICAFNLTSGGPWLTTHEWSYDGTTWKVTENKNFVQYDKGSPVEATALVPWAGDRGRFPTYQLDVVVPYARNSTAAPVQKAYSFGRTAIPTCVIQSPAQDATVPTAKPDVVVSVTGSGADAGVVRGRVRLQVSPSSNFDTGVITITQDRSSEVYFGSTASSVKISLANYPLIQGTYYVRAQVLNQFQYAGSWSSTRRIFVSHPPRATQLTPADNAVLIYSAGGSVFGWKFTDAYADDTQTAFRIRAADSSGTSVFDTSKTATSAGTRTALITISGAFVESNITWYITLWDGDDVAGPEIEAGTVFLTQVPLPAVTFPATDTTVVTTAIPTYTWTNGISGGKTQASYRLQLRDVTSKPTLIFDTRTVQSSALAYTQNSGQLKNGRKYELTLTVTDSVGLTSSVVRAFSVAWTLPGVGGQPLVFGEYMSDSGFVSVYCPVTNMDSDILYWNLYRRSLDVSPVWTLVEQRASSVDWVYNDYLCPAGVTSEYIITQLVNRYGDIVESSLDAAPRGQVDPASQYYWLIDRTDPTKSIKIPTTTSDSLSHEYEEETYTVVGKGRQVETGEDVGITGSLSAQVRDKDIGHNNAENYNLIWNPNVDNSDSTLTFPTWTFIEAGTATGLVQTSVENEPPGPGGRKGRFTLTAQKKVADTTTVITGYYTDVVAATAAYFNPVTGGNYMMSGWFCVPGGVAVAGYRAILATQYYQDTTYLSQTVAELALDTFTPVTGTTLIESRIVGNDIWYRVGRLLTMPSGCNKLRFRFSINSNTGVSTVLNPVTVGAEGFQVTLGTRTYNAFDGDDLGVMWTGDRFASASYTPGVLRARSIRQRIEWLKSSGDFLSLRNPFGDIWPVHVSGIQADRVPGVGDAEFVDLSIPYLEVRDTGVDLDDQDAPHVLPQINADDTPYYSNATVFAASGGGASIAYDDDGVPVIP